MTEPRRLLEEADGLVRQVLEAAQDDGPSEAGRLAALAALGMAAPLSAASAATGLLAQGAASTSAGVTGTGATAATGAKVAAPLILKWVAGAVIAAGSVTAVAVIRQEPTPAIEAAAPIAPSPRLSPPTPPISVSPEVAVPGAEVAVDPPPPQPMQKQVARATRRQPLVVAEPEVHPEDVTPQAPSLLSQEVTLLDRARASLVARDVSGALSALAEHARVFGEGSLVPEALALTIDAHLLEGDHARAREQAQTLAERFPESPLTKSYQSLLKSE